MMGMYPFKKRYLLLFIPIVIVVVVCICRTEMKYDDVVEYKHEMGEEFEYRDMKVAVKAVVVVEDGYIEETYVDNPMLISVYESAYDEDELIMVKLDAVGINDELFRNMISDWNIITGVEGNGVAYITDFANGELTDEKEDREIVLFFKVLDKWLEECDYEVKLMSKLYPDQHNVYVDLKE